MLFAILKALAGKPEDKKPCNLSSLTVVVKLPITVSIKITINKLIWP